MSLTETEQVFAGVSEDAVNDLMTAIFTARPRYLNYGTSLFVPATTASVTQVSAIAFPGVPGGIHYAVSFTVPRVDFHPDSSGGTSPLPPGLGQFTLTTTVRLVIACTRRQRDEGQPTTHVPPPNVVPIATALEVIARGRPTVRYFGVPGSGEVGLLVEEVEIVDITPDSLESVVECLIRMLLQAVVANLQIPFSALSMGAFQLILVRGPEMEQDQVQLYGNV
jgi:hypothetical protein